MTTPPTRNEPTPADVARVKGLLALAGQAWPGPWYTVGPPWLPSGCASYVVAGNHDPHVGKPVLDGVEIDEWDARLDGPDYSQSDADLAFAAAAREALPAVCRELLAAWEEMGRLRADNALTRESLRLYRRLCDDHGCPADQSQHEWLESVLKEIATLRRLAPLCEPHGTGTGTRSGCPYCALAELHAALSAVDNACCLEPDDTMPSAYDIDYDHARVVGAVKSLRAECDRLAALLQEHERPDCG